MKMSRAFNVINQYSKYYLSCSSSLRSNVQRTHSLKRIKQFSFYINKSVSRDYSSNVKKASRDEIKELRRRTAAGMLQCKKALEANDLDMDKAIEQLRREGSIAASKKTDTIVAEGFVSAWISPDNTVGAIVEVNCQTDFAAKGDSFTQFTRDLCTTLGHLAVERKIDVNADIVEQLNAHSMHGQSDVSVADATTALIARLGENVHIRRAFVLKSALVVGYAHGMEGGVAQGGGDVRFGRLAGLVGLSLDPFVNDSDLHARLRKLAMQVVGSSPVFVSREDVPESYIDNIIEQAKVHAEKDKAAPPPPSRSTVVKQSALLLQQFAAEGKMSVERALTVYGETFGTTVKVLDFVRAECGDGIEKPPEEDFATEVQRMAGLDNANVIKE